MIETVAIRLEKEEKDENRRKTLSGIFTFLIVAAIVALLMFFGMPYMDPPPPEEGAVVALGEPDAGMNSEEPQAEEQQTETSQEESSSQTQDIEEAPSETPSENPKPTPPTEEKKEKKKVTVPLYEESDDKKGGGKDDGEKEGTKGDPKGVPGGDPAGTGSGKTGLGEWSLKGRKLLTNPNASFSFPEEGKLTLKITVNSQGTVISATPDYKNSTVTNQTNISEAIKMVKTQYRFDVKEGASEAYGTVTIYFKKR